MCLGALIAGSIGSSLIGASSASRAARAQGEAAERASQAQVEAAQIAADTQLEMFDRSAEMLAPWLGAGGNALAALQFELGLAPRPTSLGGTVPGVAPATQTAAAAPAQAAAIPEIQQILADRSIRVRRRPGDDTGDGFVLRRPVIGYSVGDERFDTENEALAYRAALRARPQQQQPQAVPEVPTAEPGFAYRGFQETPGYRFRLGEGLNALTQQAAGSGMLLSGDTLEASQRFGEGLAASEFGAHLNRLAGLSGTGQTTAGTLGGQAITTGTNIANTQTNAGNARASSFLNAGQAQAQGIVGVNNALQGGINNLFSLYGMNQAGFFS